jgi:hypothetical protein
MFAYGCGLALLGVLIWKFAALPKIKTETLELSASTPLQVVRGHLEHPEPSISIGVPGILAKSSADTKFLVVTQAGEQLRPRNNSAMRIPRAFFKGRGHCIYLKERLFHSTTWSLDDLGKPLSTRYYGYTWFEGIRFARGDGSCPDGPLDSGNP